MFIHCFEFREGEWFAPPIAPSDESDYQLIFDKLLIDGDSIELVTWSVSPDNITIVNAKNTKTATTATVWLDDAILGELYTVKAQVTTVQGREFGRSFKLMCRRR